MTTNNENSVGTADAMPGTSGFTMAAFKASDVPVGTKLYTHPLELTDEAVFNVAHRMYCAMNLCNGDTACFHGASDEKKELWLNATRLALEGFVG